MEIELANKSLPIMAIFMTPVFLLEIRGYANLYDTTAEGPGWWYNILQIPLYLFFTDFCSYWTHRFSHHPIIYKHNLYMHKLHHKFIIPTPFSSYAFHPVDGLLQSFSHLIFSFIFPLQKIVHVALLVIANLWIIGIHDCKFLTNNLIVNDAACHSLHHYHRNCNFGQFFTIFDRLNGTYRKPETWMFQEQRLVSEMQWIEES